MGSCGGGLSVRHQMEVWGGHRPRSFLQEGLSPEQCKATPKDNEPGAVHPPNGCLHVRRPEQSKAKKNLVLKRFISTHILHAVPPMIITSLGKHAGRKSSGFRTMPSASCQRRVPTE